MLVPSIPLYDFLYAVNNNFCDSIRHIPFPIGVSLDSLDLELSVYLQPFLRYFGGRDLDLSWPLDVIGHIGHSIRRGPFPIGGLLMPSLYL